LVCDVGTLAIIHRNILSNLNVGSNFLKRNPSQFLATW
jgi:hypothetical protein